MWALPTVRAVSEHFGVPVDLLIAGEFASLIPLLNLQPYLGIVTAEPSWGLADWIDGGGTLQQAWMPPVTLEGYDQVYHLGYRGWPQQPLPFETRSQIPAEFPPIDLSRPWITVDPPPLQAFRKVAVGWSDCWFELKLGVMCSLYHTKAIDRFRVLHPEGSRWEREWLSLGGTSWVEAAQLIKGALVFLGDCSALHVLAVGMGKPVVAVEPMEARWNPIFWPLGTAGPQVTLVKGHDGKPTFDARHVADTLREVLCAL